jgi:starvation-inducible DNA-binding protein
MKQTLPTTRPTPKLHEQLRLVLADTYAIYTKTQNYHWNVTGPHFIGLHTLFEQHYVELAAAIDVLAERIRAVGDKAPAGFKIFSSLTSIADGNENNPAMVMVKELHDGHQQLVRTLKTAFAAAEEAGDSTTADILTSRIIVHEKFAWMLGAFAE